MTEIERTELERCLAMHTAPTLMGVKCASLVSVRVSDETVRTYLSFSEQIAEKYGLKMRLLCCCRERQLIYVYHERLLDAWLNSSEVAGFLADYGYCEVMGADEKLDLLASRLACGSFPHEIGAFLGYPIGDIRGFINNGGKNCLLCGCWKVYGDIEEAQRKFNIYGRCREILCDRLNNGLTLFQAIECKE